METFLSTGKSKNRIANLYPYVISGTADSWKCLPKPLLVLGTRESLYKVQQICPPEAVDESVELNWLFNVTINDISVIYVTAHRCAGGLKKKLYLRSGSQRHRHFVGFFNVPVLAPTRDQPFYTVIPTHRPIQMTDPATKTVKN